MNPSFDVLTKSYAQLRSDLRSARGMLSLVAGLREFFRDPVTPEKASEEIRRAVETREQRFLDLVRTQVYGRESSPYLKLFQVAGCDFADLQTQMRRHGLEKTLEKLAQEGVYLTQDEFKGKKEIVRWGRSFAVSSKDFRLRRANRGLMLSQSSGTTGLPQRHALSLEHLAKSSVANAIFFSAHDFFPYCHAVYDAILPTAGGIRYLLRFAKNGIKVDRWFARRVPMNSRAEAIFHRCTTALIVLAGKSFGPGVPWPDFVEGLEIGRIVRWIAEKKRVGKKCCVRTTASNAVRIARTAQTMGQSLDGAKFVVSGEPLTESKRDFIEKVGGHAIPCYG